MAFGLMVLVALALVLAGLAQFAAPADEGEVEDGPMSRERRLLAGRVQESRAFAAEQERLLREIAGLQTMMRALDPDLYGTRIERLDSARKIVEEQIRIERELLAEYEKAQRILDIEIETVRVVGELGGDVMESVSQRLAELDSARDANRQLRYQLEANEEVERLLRGQTGL